MATCIEWSLNNILSKLDNHEKEYPKLFRIWKKELEELIDFKEKELIKKLVNRIKWEPLYDIWLEYVKQIDKDYKTYEESIEFAKWYNASVRITNERMEALWKYYEDVLYRI